MPKLTLTKTLINTFGTNLGLAVLFYTAGARLDTTCQSFSVSESRLLRAYHKVLTGKV
jgi:hypothetical protein